MTKMEMWSRIGCGKIRCSILDMLHLRRLLGTQMDITIQAVQVKIVIWAVGDMHLDFRGKIQFGGMNLGFISWSNI
jgi:hypothetical protein